MIFFYLKLKRFDQKPYSFSIMLYFLDFGDILICDAIICINFQIFSVYVAKL